jgi:hypothetical protein
VSTAAGRALLAGSAGNASVSRIAGHAVDTRIGSHPAGLSLVLRSAGSGKGSGSGGRESMAGRKAAAAGGKSSAAPADGAAALSPGLAISSATRLSAAMMIEGSGLSPACETAPILAPAVAASELPECRDADNGSDGELVSERHRSSHSSVVPPQARTYAQSTGRSGSDGPISAALMESNGK